MAATVLHAGFHKTATTTLQAFCARERRALLERGIFYPRDPRAEWTAQHSTAYAFSAPREGGGPNDLFLSERELYARMVSAPRETEGPIEDAPADARLRVLSSELFSTFDRGELLRLLAAAAPVERVVLYHRDGIRFLHSCWSAKVRWGGTQSFPSFLAATLAGEERTPIRGALRYVTLARELAGPERVMLRSYDAAARGGIISDFLTNVLGVSGTWPTTSEERLNASPPIEHTELVRLLRLCTSRPIAYQRAAATIASPEAAPALGFVRAHLVDVTLGAAWTPRAIVDRAGSLIDAPAIAWRFPLDDARACIDDQRTSLADFGSVAVDLIRLLSS